MNANCPKEKPLCITIPLEKFACQCHLVYSIPLACIDLARYEPLEIQYKSEKIVLTPTLLLAYGLLGQLIFSDPDQTNLFGKKNSHSSLKDFCQYK